MIVRAPSGQGLTGVNATVSDLVGPGTIAAGERDPVPGALRHGDAIEPGSRPIRPVGMRDALIPFTHPETGQALGGRFPARRSR